MGKFLLKLTLLFSICLTTMGCSMFGEAIADDDIYGMPSVSVVISNGTPYYYNSSVLYYYLNGYYYYPYYLDGRMYFHRYYRPHNFRHHQPKPQPRPRSFHGGRRPSVPNGSRPGSRQNTNQSRPGGGIGWQHSGGGSHGPGAHSPSNHGGNGRVGGHRR